jgi:hypothetical protein
MTVLKASIFLTVFTSSSQQQRNMRSLCCEAGTARAFTARPAGRVTKTAVCGTARSTARRIESRAIVRRKRRAIRQGLRDSLGVPLRKQRASVAEGGAKWAGTGQASPVNPEDVP